MIRHSNPNRPALPEKLDLVSLLLESHRFSLKTSDTEGDETLYLTRSGEGTWTPPHSTISPEEFRVLDEAMYLELIIDDEGFVHFIAGE